MNIILPFFFGFLAAILGVIPPGIINMTAAKISLIDGRKRAMMFVLGALIIVFFQTYLSVIFAQYIDKHDEVVVLLREIGFAIFVVLTIYFLVFAKTPKIKQTNLLDDEQLNKEILASKKELFELRLRQSTNQYFTPHSFRHIKHRLGQLLMIQKERKNINITTSKRRG